MKMAKRLKVKMRAINKLAIADDEFLPSLYHSSDHKEKEIPSTRLEEFINSINP